jgi:integration host factor subunit alpha
LAQPKTITRADLVEALFKNARTPRALATAFLEAMLLRLEQSLVRGDTVKLARFGNFQVRSKTARVGRNPKTGEEVPITPRRVVTFKPSPMLRMRLEKSETKSTRSARAAKTAKPAKTARAKKTATADAAKAAKNTRPRKRSG